MLSGISPLLWLKTLVTKWKLNIWEKIELTAGKIIQDTDCVVLAFNRKTLSEVLPHIIKWSHRIPRFFSFCFANEAEVAYYDTSIKKTDLKQDWMNTIVGDRWESSTQNCRSYRQIFKSESNKFKEHFNHTGGRSQKIIFLLACCQTDVAIRVFTEAQNDSLLPYYCSTFLMHSFSILISNGWILWDLIVPFYFTLLVSQVST